MLEIKYDIKTIEPYGKIATMYVIGSLDSKSAIQTEDIFKLLIDGKNIHYIIVDCTQMIYLSSAGIGNLILNLQKIRGIGGELKLLNMQTKLVQ